MFKSILQMFESMEPVRPRGVEGLVAFRIVTGVALLYQLLVNYGQRRFIWGPEGILAFEDWSTALRSSNFNFFATDSVLGFELAYHAILLISFLWTFGVSPRITTVAMWFATWSLHDRNTFVLTGGNNLAQILLFYAIFAHLGGRRRDFPKGRLRPYAIVLHNAAYVAIVVQVCLVYFSAGVWKLHGDRWFFGSALYYALRTPEFFLPEVSPLIYQNAVIVVCLSYATWIFQLAFPFAIFINRPTRLLILAIALAFHCSIAVVMGLPVFAALMIGADLALLHDDDFRLLRRVLDSFRRSSDHRLRVREPQETMLESPQ